MKKHVGIFLAAAGLATAAHAQVGAETVYQGSRLHAGAAANDGIGTDQCSNTLAYDSGNPFQYGTGRTVGTGSDWRVYQPFQLDDDWAICGFDLDGWYVTGSPRHFEVQFYPDDGSGDQPDVNQPILSTPAQMELTTFAQGEDWVSVDIDETCFEADTLYWLEAKIPAGSDHWSAIYRDTPFGMQSYSTQGGGFVQKFRAPPIAMRLRGEQGCVPGGDCFFQTGCPADVNGDQVADVNDFFAYLDLFDAGDVCADVNEDDQIDVNDFFTYLDLFDAGC